MNPQREHFPAPPPRSPKRVDTLSCCLDHRHKQQSGSVPPTRRRREATLSSTGVNSNIQAPSRGAISIATPARPLSPVATPEWKRVQPLSRRLVPGSFGRCPAHTAPDRFGPSRWWSVCGKGVPRLRFGLCPAGPGHQALALEPHPQGLAPGGGPQ